MVAIIDQSKASYPKRIMMKMWWMWSTTDGRYNSMPSMINVCMNDDMECFGIETHGCDTCLMMANIIDMFILNKKRANQ